LEAELSQYKNENTRWMDYKSWMGKTYTRT
jgi:hypothetical protein